MPDNPPLHWTAAAEGYRISLAVGAAAASERQIRYLAEALASMAIHLDYEKRAPISRAPVIRLGVALAISFLAHLLVLQFYVVLPIRHTLNDVRLNKCVAISLGYWLVVLLLVARRRLRPTLADLAVIAFGYPLAILTCHVATEHGL